MVKAINIEGEAKCESTLSILPSITNIPVINEPINLQPNGFPPEFLQLFTDQQTFANSTIKFEARLIGTQPLKVQIQAKIFLHFLKFFHSFRSIGCSMVHQSIYKIIHGINNKFSTIYIP